MPTVTTSFTIMNDQHYAISAGDFTWGLPFDSTIHRLPPSDQRDQIVIEEFPEDDGNIFTNMFDAQPIPFFDRQPLNGFVYYIDTDTNIETIQLALASTHEEPIPNTGFTLLTSDKTRIKLYRKDAHFDRQTQGPGRISVWTWTNQWYPNNIANFENFLGIKNNAREGASVPVKVQFVNGHFEKVINKLVSKDLGDNLSNQTALQLDTTNAIIPGHTVQGVQFEVTGTKIHDAMQNPYPDKHQHLGDVNYGPELRPEVYPVNCKVFQAYSQPKSVDTTARKVTVPDWILGKRSDLSAQNLIGWKSTLVGRKIRNADGSFQATITDALFNTGVREVQAFDIDLDGTIDALSDGLILLRAYFGLTEFSLYDGLLGTEAERTTGSQLINYIMNPYMKQLGNIDGTVTQGQIYNLNQIDAGSEYRVVTFGSLPFQQQLDAWHASGVPENLTTAETIVGTKFIATPRASEFPNNISGTVREIVPTLDALTDGLSILRVMFGETPQNAINNAVATDTPLTNEEIYNNLRKIKGSPVHDVAQAMIKIGSDLLPLEDQTVAVSDNPDPETILTYNIADTAYKHPSVDETLYIEQLPYISPVAGPMGVPYVYPQETHNVKEPGYSGKRGSWTKTFNSERTIVDRIISFSNNTLIVPESEGHFSATFQVISGNVSGAPESRSFTEFTLQGVAGPSKTITLNHTQAGGPVTTKLLAEETLAPWGETVLWKVRNETERGTPLATVVETDNCSLANLETLEDMYSHNSFAHLVLSPGFGGERYRARILSNYENNKETEFIIEGRVAGQSRQKTVLFSDPYGSAVTGITVQENEPLVGTDGISARIVLNTNISEDLVLNKSSAFKDIIGQLVTATVTNETGGSVVTKTGPIKAVRNVENSFDLVFDSCLFVPGPTVLTWGFDMSITVKGIRPNNSDATYTVHLSGTHEQDYGMEILNPTGGTRLNTLTKPLRFITANAGNISSPQRDVTDRSIEGPFVYDADFDDRTYIVESAERDPNRAFNATTLYVPDSEFKYRKHFFEGYYNGRKVIDREFASDQFGERYEYNEFLRPDVSHPGDDVYQYARGAFVRSAYSGNRYYEWYKIKRLTSRSDVVYSYPTAANVTFGDDFEEGNVYAAINNEPESMVSVEFGTDNQSPTYNIIPTNWTYGGQQEDHLNHQFDLLFFKLGGD